MTRNVDDINLQSLTFHVLTVGIFQWKTIGQHGRLISVTDDAIMRVFCMCFILFRHYLMTF